MSERPSPDIEIDGFYIVHQHDHVGHAGIHVSYTALSGQQRNRHAQLEVPRRLKVDFRCSSAEPPANHAGIRAERHATRRRDAKLERQAHGAERRVATQLADAPILVEVQNPKCLCGIMLDEHNAICANASCPRTDSTYRGRILERRRIFGSRVKENEVVSRAAHLPEPSPTDRRHLRSTCPVIAQILPVTVHQRRRQTIKTASRTMPRLILLVPWARSVKTIGISSGLNPFRTARKLISIWNA